MTPAVTRFFESAARWFAYRLPRRIVYWATIRLFAHATTGQYGNTVVPELDIGTALNRWDDPMTDRTPAAQTSEPRRIESEAQRLTVEQYGPCPTAIRPGYDRPSDWPWRYAHAASIEGAHWNIYTALGDINRDYFIGMVGYEADAKAIVEQHNAALAREETGA